MKLQIAPGLELPIDAVTQKLAFLGRTGSGKTYAATKLAEEMHGAGAQILALDPVGVWYGLRLAANGKDVGIKDVHIFGGLHGDVPLEPTGGALIADTVVDTGISAVIDVSQFESDAEKARFARAFADRFFFRKKSAPSAVHLFLEEGQEFIPQNPGRDDALMLHAFTRLWKLGRNFGVGGSIISQRPQEVNKKALNMTECLLAFQMTGIQERKTVKAWIHDKGLEDDIESDLPKLQVGSAHVWSPQWLQISKVVHVSRKATFNASSTPGVGAAAKARELAPIDIEKIKKQMAGTIERAKATDPRELRKRVLELERELAARPTAKTEMKRVEISVVKPADLKRAEKLIERLCAIQGQAVDVVNRVGEEASALSRAIDSAKRTGNEQGISRDLSRDLSRDRKPITHGEASINVGHFLGHAGNITKTIPPPARRGSPSDAAAGLPPMLRAILTALAQHPRGLTKGQILVFAGYRSSGPVSKTFAEISRNGWAEGSPVLQITPAGLKTLGAFDPLPTGEELRAKLLNEAGPMERAILGVLFQVYPQSISKGAILERSGYASSGPVSKVFAKIVKINYAVPAGRGELRASEDLFG